MAEPSGHAVGVERRADEIALYRVAAGLTQKRQLRLRLDAFGDHLDRQAVRELRQRKRDDLFRTRVAGLLDQRAIQLDDVDRQAPQVADGRGAAVTEVVQRQMRAELLELA